VLEPARPDFRQMLPHAAASVSMCGYNTALDLLQAGTPAVFVPFDAGNEVEQTLRARSLAALPGFAVSPAADLTPQRLCAAIASAMRQPQREVHNLRFDGATQSVEIAEKRLKDHQ
jgi:predicted glycosyltransferase